MNFQCPKILIASILFLLVSANIFAQERVYFNSYSEKVKNISDATYYEITVVDLNNKEKKTVYSYTLNDSIKSEKSFYRDKLDGISKTYFANGKIENELSFRKGDLNGNLKKFWENGKIRREENYNKGKMTEGICYNREGNEIEYFPSKCDYKLSPPYKDLNDYINKNFKMTSELMESSKSGRIVITFTVTKEGKVEDITLIEGYTAKLNEKFIKLITSLPITSPAKVENESIDSIVVYPFDFAFENN
jgi:hypothetical protein